MRDFETYFEIFLARHKNDKNFPSIRGYDTTTKESIQTLKAYFEDFWYESQMNCGIEYEIKIDSLKKEIRLLENEIERLEEEIYDSSNEVILI